MSSKTKILVFHQKEVLYTCIFTLLGILFFLLLIVMFAPNKKDDNLSSKALYNPGIYTTSLLFHNNTLDVEVIVTESNIESIRLVQLDEVVSTMYPLIEPSFQDLISQIYDKQSLDGITYAQDNKYTTLILLDAIRTSLEKASILDSALPTN